CLRCGFLAAKVGDYSSLKLTREDVNLHLTLLAESPAAAHSLVVRLEAVRDAHERHAGAVLPVQPPPAYRRLANQDADTASGKVGKAHLFRVGIIRPANLHGIRDSLTQRISLSVQVTPHNPWLRGVGINHRRAFRYACIKACFSGAPALAQCLRLD